MEGGDMLPTNLFTTKFISYATQVIQADADFMEHPAQQAKQPQ
jgi:hypothetical protein